MIIFQLGRIINPPELSLSTSLTNEEHNSAQNWIPEDQDQFKFKSQEDDVSNGKHNRNRNGKKQTHQGGGEDANQNKWYHGENGGKGGGRELPPNFQIDEDAQMGKQYSPIVHGPKWFPSKVRIIN